MKNAFNQDDVTEFIGRINKLTVDTKPKWGKMNVEQMLAHCNVTYEMVYDNIHSKPNLLMRLLLKLLAKKQVVSEKPYPRNLGTAPQFIIKGDCNFELEKNKNQIKKLLQEELIIRYQYREGLYNYYTKNNIEIKKAIDALNNTSLYKKTLNK